MQWSCARMYHFFLLKGDQSVISQRSGYVCVVIGGRKENTVSARICIQAVKSVCDMNKIYQSSNEYTALVFQDLVACATRPVLAKQFSMLKYNALASSVKDTYWTEKSWLDNYHFSAGVSSVSVGRTSVSCFVHLHYSTTYFPRLSYVKFISIGQVTMWRRLFEVWRTIACSPRLPLTRSSVVREVFRRVCGVRVLSEIAPRFWSALRDIWGTSKKLALYVCLVNSRFQ